MSHSYDDESVHSDEEIAEDSETSEESLDEEEQEYVGDAWKRMKTEAVERHTEELGNLIQSYIQSGSSEEVAKVKAANDLVPTFRKELREVLFEHLQWMHFLRKDPIYKKIMATRKHLIDMEEYGWEEATESAINQRKFLLSKMFNKREIPQESGDSNYQPLNKYPRRYY